MRCADARPLLSARLDGELEPAEAVALEDHLAACPECAAESERLETVRAAFRALPPAAPPRDLARAVMERIRAGEAGSAPVPAARRRWPLVARTAAALALAAAGLGAVWLASAPEAPAVPAEGPVPVAEFASHALGADAGCDAEGDCLQLAAPCDSPAECGGAPPCSQPGECAGRFE